MASPRRRSAFLAFACIAVALGLVADCDRMCAQTPLLLSALGYDATGNLYIADRDRNQVFELTSTGVFTVFAGTGTQGFGGDGGPAIAATLNAPEGLAVGADGTVYVADTGNQRLRAIANNTIQTVAGTGVRGFSGDGSAALNAMLDRPSCVSLDGHGTLYICDTGNHRIRSMINGMIGTFAGTRVQGFAGDGGLATAAELNAPQGVAVDGAGRVYIADTLNQRVRMVGVGGVMTTVAGNGVATYSGDGGPAASASLSLPTEVAVDLAGDVLIADTGNERIRLVTPSGMISTVAGSGVQGFSNDGAAAASAALNRPLALGFAASGNLVFSDSQNGRVRIISAAGSMYTLVPAPVPVLSQTTLLLAAQSVYGMPSATIGVTTNALPPTGNVELLDGTTVVATTPLKNGTVVVSLASLPVGAHQIQAIYAGDAFNASSASASVKLNITPASLTVSATPLSAAYGAALPALTGTIAGLLAQDVATTSVQFSTSATAVSPVGTYSILATLTGASSANYALIVSASSGIFTIVPAASSLALQTPSSSSYAGLPILLTAQVTSSTAAVPSGVVQFFDAGTLIATQTTSSGVVSTTYIPSASGTHSLTASFGDNPNFLPSSSAALVVATAPMPGFSLVAGSTAQTIQGGLAATYNLNVMSSGGTFTGTVSFAVSGLPKGATATFSPALVVPGVTGATTAMSVQTVPLTAQSSPAMPRGVLWSMGVLAFFFARRRNKSWLAATCCGALACCALLMSAGCGARTVDSAVTVSQLSQLNVTATSTNLAGIVVSQTLTLNLTVD
jgi:hypothetical protein